VQIPNKSTYVSVAFLYPARISVSGVGSIVAGMERLLVPKAAGRYSGGIQRAAGLSVPPDDATAGKRRHSWNWSAAALLHCFLLSSPTHTVQQPDAKRNCLVASGRAA